MTKLFVPIFRIFHQEAGWDFDETLIKKAKERSKNKERTDKIH